MRLLHFLLLLCITTIHAQTITGYVYSAADGQPLDGASVYLDGTTFSTSTNGEGFFKLTTPQKYDATLVVSFIGFDKYRINDPYKTSGALKINLVPNAVSLDEVVVTHKQAFTRKDMLKAFREQFLGTSDAGKSCKILNEDDITLFYDVTTNTLNASANKPIQIQNKRLEYDLSYDLAAFEVRYRIKSLEANYIINSGFAGTTLFRDKSVKNKAVKKRKETYAGSVPHFIKTIADNNWEKAKFRLYMGNFPTSPARCLQVTDTLGLKKVSLVKSAMEARHTGPTFSSVTTAYRLNVLDAERRNSFFYFNRDEFYIDQNGMFSPIDALIFGGYMGSLKAGDMLPADYVYIE